MEGLRWSWLAAPYFACTLAILAVAVATALIRGDRVMRLGMIGAAVTAVPWALCQALAALTDDASIAKHLLQLGQGPVALVGPNLLLVLLAVSGQLERFRWIARVSAAIATCFLVAAWSTSWTTPGVQRLASGMYYVSPGPLTGIHLSQLALWLVVGLVILRRSSPLGEQRRMMRMLVGILVLGAIASLDVLLLYGIWGTYPIAWLAALISACIALYMVLRTDLLRPQGFDRGVAIELGAFALAIAITGVLALALHGESPGAVAASSSVVWAALMAGAWAYERSRPVRVADERALEQFAARVATLDDPVKIAEWLGALWKRAVGIEIRATWSVDSSINTPLRAAELRAPAGPGLAINTPLRAAELRAPAGPGLAINTPLRAAELRAPAGPGLAINTPLRAAELRAPAGPGLAINTPLRAAELRAPAGPGLAINTPLRAAELRAPAGPGLAINTPLRAAELRAPAGPGISLVALTGGARAVLDPDLAAWLVELAGPLAVSDLATMRVGALRGKLEAVFHEGRAKPAPLHFRSGLVVPLVDRGELVGLIEASYDKALRDAERGLVAESARAAARAFTFVGLARAASQERETAREVEVADALRLQASASRDAELGRWAVAAEYRTAPRTTGAGWSAIELADGRLALLATEAQAHGVAAALATAALTGAFAAATAATTAGEAVGTRSEITLDELLSAMGASSEGVMRGGEPVAAFLAILDATAHTIEWACAGHPGAFLIGPIAAVESGLPLGSTKGVRPNATPLGSGANAPGASLTIATRGTTTLPADTLLVVASSALRGSDDARWQQTLREHAPASGRLASVLVENSLRASDPSEDLLAVVVRSR